MQRADKVTCRKRHGQSQPEGLNLDACIEDLEKACYEEAIRRKDGNRGAAARLLGIKPHTFRKRTIEKFGL